MFAPGNRNRPPDPEPGTDGGQAVALRISRSKGAFYRCSFYGHQDTLYDHRGLHYFYNCLIQGTVDFIFGAGRSSYDVCDHHHPFFMAPRAHWIQAVHLKFKRCPIFKECCLNSLAKEVSFLTAQRRMEGTLMSGFSFTNCKITGSGRAYLGRAWGDHSTVVFSYALMDNIIIPQGWDDWGIPKRDLTVYYGEYKCSGPGSNRMGRVPWSPSLSDEEGKNFIGTQYIEGTPSI